MILDLIASVGGLVFPPVFDFVKKKFLKTKADTPEATLSSLAVTKPEVMPDYIKAQTEMIKSQVHFFNRDVIGEVSRWVSDLRAAIRPIFVILSLVIVGISIFCQLQIPENFKLLMDVCIGSWFGSRIAK